MTSAVRTLTLAAASAAACLAAVCSPLAAAQTAPAAPIAEPFSLPFGPVPSTLHGVPCTVSGEAGLACFPADVTTQPVIGVTVSDWTRPLSRQDLVRFVEDTIYEGSPGKLLQRVDFAPPADPDATGFRALYQTSAGNHHVWAVVSHGKLVIAIAITPAPDAFAAMDRDIERKIFGIAPR